MTVATRRASAKSVNGRHYVRFHCPGCDTIHTCQGWEFNGNEERPTLHPSVLVTYNGADAGVDGAPPARCHSFVRKGRIEFLGDCSHALAGQTVDLPEWPAERWGP